MGGFATAYAGCRDRIGEMTGTLDDADAARSVPACPRWSVHDVVAHLAGVVDDALNGRLDGVAEDPWTAAQVDARRGVAVGEMLAAWNVMAPAFEARLDGIGRLGPQAVADVVTHEHDIRGALGRPGSRDSDAVRLGFEFIANGFVHSAAANGLSVRVRATDGTTIGDQGSLVVGGEPFELLRALTGRRSEGQIRALDWTGDVDTAVPAFTWGPFRPAAEAITE